MSDPQAAMRLTLRDVMLRRYLRLGESHTLSEVMGFLTDARFMEEGTPFLVVIGSDGRLAGMLEPDRILAALVDNQDVSTLDETQLHQQLLANLTKTVGAVMSREIPALPPDAFLEQAFLCIAQSDTEAVAIVEDDRVIGLVTARILFEKASTLTVGALTGGIIPQNPR